MPSLDFETIDVVQFHSLTPGPHLLVTGAIHGNEICGTAGIIDIIERFHTGALRLKRGTLTFVPVCNPQAFAKGVRGIDANLNRVIAPHKKPKNYEEKLACRLLPLIDAADYMLDLHSYSCQGTAYVFQDYADKKTAAFADALGLPHIITGWPKMFAHADAKGLNGGDTVSYAHTKGVTGVVVECGNHEDPQSPVIAVRMIENAMAYLDMASPLRLKRSRGKKRVIHGRKVFKRPPDCQFIAPWKDFDRVAKGDIIALCADGTTIKADKDSTILLPNASAKVGIEWFYLGEEKP